MRRVQFSTVSRIDTLGKPQRQPYIYVRAANQRHVVSVDQLHDVSGIPTGFFLLLHWSPLIVLQSFKIDFYPGEHVTAVLPGGDRVEAIIREKTMFPELRFASGEIQRKGYSRYTVKMVNRNEEEAQIDNEHLIRDKKTFTKHMLRSFIKNTVAREPWTGAPWLVKDEYATRYKIPSTVPVHLQRATTTAERKAQQARRKQGSAGVSVDVMTNGSASPPSPVEIRPAPKSHKSKTQQAMKMSKLFQESRIESPSMAGSPWAGSPMGTPDGSIHKLNLKALVKSDPTPPPPPPLPKLIKYPIEDLDLPLQENACRPALHHLSSIVIAPSSSSAATKENGIDEEKAAFYLSTWVFLNIYCEPFLLDSFTFDDYVQALQYHNEDMDCELFVEIHCTLLKAIVNDQGVVQVQLPESEEEDEEEEEEEEGGGEGEDEDEEMEDGEPEKEDGDSAQDVILMNGGDSDENNDGSRKSTDRGKKHRADELFDNGGWIQLLKARQFKSGGWQAIVVGILYQLSWDSHFSKDTEDILAYLAPPDERPTMETVKTRYTTMNSNLRVMVIQLLSRLTHETRTVRDYMEECSEEMTKHRKEKIEHQRNRKIL